MEIPINKETGMLLLNKLFEFSGRAARREYFLYSLAISVTMVVLFAIGAFLAGISDWLIILALPFFIAAILLILALLATLFRRLHDLGLSGFWIFYFIPFVGLPALIFAYLLGVDDSAKSVIERIKGFGSPWLGWILMILFWTAGSWFGSILILAATGTKGDNFYGPEPLAKAV